MRRHYGHVLLFAVAAFAAAGSAQAAKTDVLTQEVCKSALPHVARTYAGLLEPVRHKGFCIAGDFNGDAKPDALMVVKVRGGKLAATTGIRTIYPFFDEETPRDRMQFLALHSTPTSKSDWSQYDKLLLDGGSPILMLDERDTESDMERVTRRSRDVKELQVPVRDMRGEGVSLQTQAVLAILYWNGKTYVFHEDPAGP